MAIFGDRRPGKFLKRCSTTALLLLGGSSGIRAQATSGQGECCAALEKINFSSNLPVVIIESLSGTTIEYDAWQQVKFCTCTPPEVAGDSIEDYNGYAKAAGRGNSSKDFKKTQFKVELQDENGDGADFELLGFPKEEDFIFYGPELDKTLMKNYLAYNIGRGSGEYASRTQFVEIFSMEDGQPLSQDDYRGVYLMVEKQKRDKNRIDIEKVDDEDPSGGYILVYDNDNFDWNETVVGPFSNFGMDQPFVLKEPKELTNAQRDYLNKYLNDFMQSLTSDNWLDLPEEQNYKSFIDEESFIKYLLAVEITKNPDGYRGSTYLHKDKQGPLQMGPMWDYNEAFGMCCGYPIDGWQREGESIDGIAGGSAISPNGFRFLICEDQERCQVDASDGISFWYRRMWQDPSFRNQTSAIWKDLRAGDWSDEAIAGIFNSAKDQLDQGAVVRNYDTYADILLEGMPATDGRKLWKNETDRIETWLFERLHWMDEALDQPKASYAI